MEHQLCRSIVAVLATLSKLRKRTICDFSDEDIVKVYYWSVLHDRPTCWACDLNIGRFGRRRRSAASLASDHVATVAQPVGAKPFERSGTTCHRPQRPGLFWMIDGKPLPISGCSKDRQAGYGRAANCKAKGYKIHAIVDPQGAIAAWRLAPMNKDERVMAERLLRTAPIKATSSATPTTIPTSCTRSVTGASNCNWSHVGVTALKHGTGHRKQTAGRLRSMRLVENPYPAFARPPAAGS